MPLDYLALSAVHAVVRLGSFEKAAHALAITPSAVSQRVKAMEERLGTVLILRGQPSTATEVGARLCQHFEQVSLLEQGLADLSAADGLPAARTNVRIAVNADSLATWFIDAMAETDGMLFDLVIDDQDHSADWLRRGEVLAALSGSPLPVRGCDSLRLGALRYLATASPAFASRWFGGGVTLEAILAAPALTFDRKDALQARWLEGVLGEAPNVPTHWLPSSQGFVEAAVAGIGWGMNPELLVRHYIETGKLIALTDRPFLDVPLFWQTSRIVSAALRPLTAAVRRAAARCLVD
jgi:LysR family transcriptional regulator (chromosome initiation inhibitor)